MFEGSYKEEPSGINPISAKILKDNNNNLNSLYIIDKEKSLKKNGDPKKNPCYKLKARSRLYSIQLSFFLLNKILKSKLIKQRILRFI